MRCSLPGTSTFGRLAASRLIAAPSEPTVAWSGSKCTVTLAYPATACLTSRRLRRAAASAMARVFRAVSSRDPSSARRAVSPSGLIRTLGPPLRRFCTEGGGGISAHKDGVEHARHDADAEERGAGEADRPGGDDRGDGDIPGGEVPPHAAQRRSEIKEVSGALRRGVARCRVRHEQQHDDAPRQSEDENGGDE